MSKLIESNAHLHAAILQNDLEWARMAIQFGANPNAADEEGNSCLHLLFLAATEASQDQIQEFVALLMQAGASLGATNKKGQTPIDLAEEMDRWDIALSLATYQIDSP